MPSGFVYKVNMFTAAMQLKSANASSEKKKKYCV